MYMKSSSVNHVCKLMSVGRPVGGTRLMLDCFQQGCKGKPVLLKKSVKYVAETFYGEKGGYSYISGLPNLVLSLKFTSCMQVFFS